MSATAPSCGTSFRFLGNHLVNDHLHLHVKIHAEKPRL